MNRLTWVGAVCTLLAAATLVGATTGFSAASADRGLSVDVADDDRAYLGVETDATPKYGCGTEVTVTNRFSTTLETVTVEGGHHQPRENHPHETETIEDIGPGEAETVIVSLDKTATDHDVTVQADGEDVSIELTRAVDTSGTPPCGSPGADRGSDRGRSH